jgi:hypothetical protein
MCAISEKTARTFLDSSSTRDSPETGAITGEDGEDEDVLLTPLCFKKISKHFHGWLKIPKVPILDTLLQLLPQERQTIVGFKSPAQTSPTLPKRLVALEGSY